MARRTKLSNEQADRTLRLTYRQVLFILPLGDRLLTGCADSPRASGLAFGLALAVRPAGSAEAPRARVGPEDAFCGAVFAERLERIFGCPCGWRGRPGQCAAFRPADCDLSPGDRRTWRETTAPPARAARDPRRVTAGRVLRRGAGHRRGGQRPATVRYRARGSGPGCPHLRRESPSPPGRHGAARPARSRSPWCPAHPPRDRPEPVGLARRRCALDDREDNPHSLDRPDCVLRRLICDI